MGTRYFLFFLFSFISIYSFGQSGFIAGSVRDSVNKESIVGGVIIVVGRTEGTVTDLDGKFIIPIEAGKYSLTVKFEGYKEKTIENVLVQAGDTANIDFRMSTEKGDGSAEVLKEVHVVGVKTTGSVNAVVEEIRKVNNVVSGISEQEMRSLPNRTAADATRRISGVTIADNRFVMVRGLNQRYNTVMLNNAIAPSSEADIRAFSFDILPAGVIDRIMIYKTPAPEIPGDFAGGVIKVYTKNVPLNNSFTVNYSGSYRQNTTFQSFYEQKHGKNAWLGFDKTYDLPKGLPSPLIGDKPGPNDVNTAMEINKKFNNNWQAIKSDAMPDQRLNIGLTRRIVLSKNLILGTITSGNYSNTKSYSRVFREALFVGGNNELIKGLKLVDRNYDHSVVLGGMQNISLLVGDKHKFDFKNLYNHMQSSMYTYRKGLTRELDWTPIYPYQYFKGYGLRNLTRSIYSGQFNGSHELSKNFNVNYMIGYSKTVRDEPDYRRYIESREYDIKTGVPKQDWQVPLPGPTAYQMLGRVFAKTNEEAKMAALNFEEEIPITKNFEPKIKGGFYLENKDRRYQLRPIGVNANSDKFSSLPLDSILQEKNFQSDTGLFYGELNAANLSYVAHSKLKAGYLAFNIPVISKVSIYAGLRVENYTQTVNTNDASSFPVVVDSSYTSYLPSINITYNLTEKRLFRLAYGKTLNRPEFRELSPTFYYDFESGVRTDGNSALKTAIIHNYDFRYELYPNPGETFSVGIFYKKFINPIENVYINYSNGINFGFQNALSAQSIGGEVEFRKNIGSLLKTNSFLDGLSLNLNAALIKSRVELPNAGNLQQSKRPMAGQSPYILNVGVFYIDDSLGVKASIGYNIIGRRIAVVGNYQIPEVYEMPRNAIDISVSKNIGKHWELQVSVQDLLNARYRFIQDQNKDKKFDRSGKEDNIFSSYRRGSYYTVGLTYNF